MKTLRQQRKARRKKIENIPISSYLFDILTKARNSSSLTSVRALILKANTRNEYFYYLPRICSHCGHELLIVRDTLRYGRPACLHCHSIIWPGLHCLNSDNAYLLTWNQKKPKFTCYTRLPVLENISSSTSTRIG